VFSVFSHERLKSSTKIEDETSSMITAITDNYAAATKNDTYEINVDQATYSRNHTAGITANHAASEKENL
jgi:hypothetical protein